MLKYLAFINVLILRIFAVGFFFLYYGRKSLKNMDLFLKILFILSLATGSGTSWRPRCLQTWATVNWFLCGTQGSLWFFFLEIFCFIFILISFKFFFFEIVGFLQFFLSCLSWFGVCCKFLLYILDSSFSFTTSFISWILSMSLCLNFWLKAWFFPPKESSCKISTQSVKKWLRYRL